MPLHKPVQQSAEQLRSVATEIARAAADLRGIAEAMEQAQFPDLVVTNYDQLFRAQGYVDNYCHAAKKALREARDERADFATKKAKPKK